VGARQGPERIVTTFVCPSCERVRPKSERIEVRRESRDANYNRRHVVQIKILCRSCDDTEVELLRPLKVPNIPQNDLFGGGT
jgi:hypothetical protein